MNEDIERKAPIITIRLRKRSDHSDILNVDAEKEPNR
jgi:hypothetical protein